MTDLFDLDGSVVVVTGGNGGIGLGMADALSAAGAAVSIWGTDPEKNAAAAERLSANRGPVQALECDVTSRTQVDVAMSTVVEEFGRLDGCFANAGASMPASSFVDLDPALWRRVLAINLDGAFHTLQAAAARMVARAKRGEPGGRLVVTSSLAAISGAARNEHYAASKGAVVSMMKALAVELGRYGITANSILPGWVETDMTEGVLDHERFVERVLPRIPLRRWGRPADFGGIAVYLMSAAAAYHTGDTLLIDGGYAVF
jgi:NAD(P)-dependent dehydrogenase (short-subunit alcohol dehydrogenase family)